jgi:uncharacterized protein YbjT (DUF2867 family)
MIVLVAGAHGRLGSRVVALLLSRGHVVRALVRTDAQAAVLRRAGAAAVVADLRGDVEWTADGCEAAVFTAAARHRRELAAVDSGGSAKLAEAAAHYDLTRFVLASVVGADRPERREGVARAFVTAKQDAERRLDGSRCRGRSCASVGSPRIPATGESTQRCAPACRSRRAGTTPPLQLRKRSSGGTSRARS